MAEYINEILNSYNLNLEHTINIILSQPHSCPCCGGMQSLGTCEYCGNKNELLEGSILKLSEEQVSTLSVILTGFIGFMHIYIISKPLTTLRMILLSTLITVFVIGIVGLRTLFSLAFITPYLLLLTLILMANTLIIFILMTNLFHKYIYKFIKRISER